MPQSRSPMLLLYPPVAKPGEPPAGIARLLGALYRYGVPAEVIDMNLEGLLYILSRRLTPADRWTERAVRNVSKNLTLLGEIGTYRSYGRYQRAIGDLNRVLEMASTSYNVHLNLANYQHSRLSPVRSEDLIHAAERPEEDPFFPYFQMRLRSASGLGSSSAVGISLNYLSQALCAFAIIGFLKRHLPATTIVLGGGLVTSWMRKPGWRNPFRGLVDHMVAGAGESQLLEIMGIEGRKREHFTPRYDFVSSVGEPETSLKSREKAARKLPAPAKHLPEGPHRPPYLSPGFILPYSSANGCYYNRCAFCPERAEGNTYLPAATGQVLADLQILVQGTQPVLLHLLDNAISPRLLKALVKSPPGLPWYGFVRVTGDLADDDFCMALKKSGCTMLQLGIESGDQGVLDGEEKGIELETASAALKSLNKAGIATYVYLLFGTPSEGLKEALKTLDFTVRHAPEISFLNLAIFNLPIHGDGAKGLTTRMHYAGDLSLYTDFDHPGGWHRAAVRQFLDKQFKRHPAVGPILRRDPPVFTSNHAPFFGLAG